MNTHTTPQHTTHTHTTQNMTLNAPTTHTTPKVRPPVAEPPKVTFEVMALYDYNGIEKGDLPLQKGQKLLVIDNSREYWWKARDANG